MKTKMGGEAAWITDLQLKKQQMTYCTQFSREKSKTWPMQDTK